MTENKGQPQISWEFNDFEPQNRNKLWYIIALIVLGLLLIYAFITLNFLFAVILIIGTITLIIKEQNGPEKVNFVITDTGIIIDDLFYRHEQLKNYFIIYQPPEIKTLYFIFKNLLQPRLAVPLNNQNPVEIKKILDKYLEEDIDKEEEPISDKLRKSLKL